MFVINPDPYSLPAYRIGPFRTIDASINHCLPNSDLIEEYFKERFRGNDYIYTENGRNALNIALRFYNLNKDDVVTIFTTTGNFYISGCVTKEIEKFCRWSRNIEDSTKLILVNHEFGFPYIDLQQLKNYKLPIIEDCAGSFFSKDKKNEIGNIGDFVIYSFPKMFPLQIGGLLVCNLPMRLDKVDQILPERLRHVKNVMSNHIKSKARITRERISNYYFLNDKFKSLGFSERFQLDFGIVPGVYMFRNNEQQLKLPDLKNYFYAHGVQCSVFYREESFYIPVHQALNEYDMLYFYEVIKSFIHRSKL